MSEALDLTPIKARLAATTPGEWKWVDVIRDVPYEGESWLGDTHLTTGNDGSLGVMGLYIEDFINEDTSELNPVLCADDENIPEDPDDPDEVDWTKWRGLIQAPNLADLEFIAQAKADIAALIAEVERLRQI